MTRLDAMTREAELFPFQLLLLFSPCAKRLTLIAIEMHNVLFEQEASTESHQITGSLG